MDLLSAVAVALHDGERIMPGAVVDFINGETDGGLADATYALGNERCASTACSGADFSPAGSILGRTADVTLPV